MAQHGQTYAETRPPAKRWRSTARHSPKPRRQQKGDTARKDICRIRAVSKKVTQHGQTIYITFLHWWPSPIKGVANYDPYRTVPCRLITWLLFLKQKVRVEINEQLKIKSPCYLPMFYPPPLGVCSWLTIFFFSIIGSERKWIEKSWIFYFTLVCRWIEWFQLSWANFEQTSCEKTNWVYEAVQDQYQIWVPNFGFQAKIQCQLTINLANKKKIFTN